MLSSILSAVGLFGLSYVRTPLEAFAAATIFGIGKSFFWPTMLGVTAEGLPSDGELPALACLAEACRSPASPRAPQNLRGSSPNKKAEVS
jgi:hypothetical protein